jgi:hypothetical protein
VADAWKRQPLLRPLTADLALDELTDPDVVVFPGGSGTRRSAPRTSGERGDGDGDGDGGRYARSSESCSSKTCA